MYRQTYFATGGDALNNAVVKYGTGCEIAFVDAQFVVR